MRGHPATGRASAVPELLCRYADRTGQAVDAAERQVEALSAAIARYRQTALDFGTGIEHLTARPDCDLAELVRAALPGMRATDQRVRLVGAAFAHAEPEAGGPARADDARIAGCLATLGAGVPEPAPAPTGEG